MKTQALLLLAGIAGIAPLHAQSLIYEFRFNDAANGTSTNSTAPGGATANFSNYVATGSGDRAPDDLYGAPGSGVSGQVGDIAFDNSGSTRMGGSGNINESGAGYGGMALVTNGADLLNGARSFTVQGWYNGASTPTNYARLIEIGSFGIWFQGTGSGTVLQASSRLDATGTTAQLLTSNDASMLQANTWTFFAFTYDGVTGVASLYGGNSENSVSLLASTTFAASTLNTVTSATSQGLAIGNGLGNASQRPFDGLLDNFRVWGEASGAGGALTKAQLEAVRLADLGYSQIPEPSAFALLAAFGALGMAATRRGGARRR